MIERRGVAYDLRGGALGLRPGAGGEEISGVVTNYHHDIHCCLLLLRAEVHERGGAREPLRGDEDRLYKPHRILLMSWHRREDNTR